MISLQNCNSLLDTSLVRGLAWMAACCIPMAVLAQSSRGLTPPVPLESGVVSSFGPAGVNPPVSIGPAPGPGYPSAGFPYAAGRVFVGPPPAGNSAYVVPFVPGPFLPVPPQPFPPQPVPLVSDPPPPQLAAYPPTMDHQVRRSTGSANLRVSVSETFLNRLIAQERVEPGPIRDVILGAQVTGRQTTVSRVRADCIPSSETGRVALVLNGDVQTMTTGVTPQAMIDTLGQQQFFAVKEVYFDGAQLSTRHATVYIRALNQTVGAMTPLTGTLFGGLADRIAFRAAERQKPASEAVARDRLADRLFPTFDGEVDSQLAQANRQLAPVRRWLESVKLWPSSQSVWTTDTHLIHEAYVGDSPAAAVAGADQLEGQSGLQLSIHESLVNTFVDRTGLKGLKTTDKQLRELQTPFLSDPDGNGSKGSDDGSSSLTPPVLPFGTNNIVTDIEFDEAEPLTVRAERDRVLLTVKARFKPAGQEVVPPMTVTIPYQTTLVGNKIRLMAGTPRVVAQDRTDPEAPPTILETAIQKIIEAELVPLECDRALPASLWTKPGPAPRVTSIKSDNGWICIAID